jgi:hypothetical protein
VLLIAAGLFLRSLSNVENVHMGYDADRLLYVGANARGVKRDSLQNIALRRRCSPRRSRCPGLSTRRWRSPFRSGRRGTSPQGSRHRFGDQAGQLHAAGRLAGFFATMGTRILSRPPVRRHRWRACAARNGGERIDGEVWPNEDAIGKCVRINATRRPARP